MSAEEADHASANYLVDNGFRPGMSGAQLYATINTGSPYTGNRSDAGAGGTWGSSDDKWNHQMAGHRAKAAALLGGDYVPTQSVYDTSGPDLDQNVYSDTRTPPAPSMTQVVAQEDQEAANGPKAYDTWSDQLYDSAAQNWYTAKAVRWGSQGDVDLNDPGWSQDEWEHIQKELPEEYHDYVLSGTSKYNRLYRLQEAQKMVERDQRAAATGTASSLTAALLTGLADPLLLPAMVLGAPELNIAKSFAGRLLTGAAIGGSVNAGLELGAKYGLDDPHTDALGAFGVGALLGGLVGPLEQPRRLPLLPVPILCVWRLGKVGALLRQPLGRPDGRPFGGGTRLRDGNLPRPLRTGGVGDR